MSDFTSTTIINSLLKVQQKDLKDQFNNTTPANDIFQRQMGRETTFGGRSVELPMRTNPNFSFAGVRGEGGDQAEGSTGTYTNATLPIYAHNSTGKFGEMGEIDTKQKAQALQSVAERTTKDLIDGFGLMLNKLHWGIGDGYIAEVASVNLNTMVVTVAAEDADQNPQDLGLKWCDIGQNFEASSSRTATNPDRYANGQVTALTAATPSFTAKGNIADLQAGDAIVIPDGLNNVSEGIFSANHNVKDTYLGITRSTAGNEYFQCIEESVAAVLSTTNLLENIIIEQLMVAADERGQPPRVGFTYRDVYLHLYKEMQSNVRFMNPQNQKRQFALGFEAITVTSPSGKLVEIFIDRHCPGSLAGGDGQLVLIEPDDWRIAQAREPGWYKDEHGSMVHQIPGTYSKKVVWLDVHNLFCDMPKRQVFIRNLRTS